ncbi:MAG: magnesium/cobalt transporter CorA [Bacteroidia bacterium]|nr:magnesium/cobalt transporter CorA [Bacteroidota bacterium]MBP6511581.1 magnesium/cobalt transporter CorA [Bacteroidia bacterium]MBP7245477.1 magnesium/cobalt transporter CorA [Bacteroidia bacterium]
MSKLKRKGFFPQSLKVWKHKRTSPGAAPGAINLAEDAKAPMLYVTSFNTELLFEMPFDSLDQVQERIEKYPEMIHWIELKGFGDRSLLERFCYEYNIHRLEMEDVINTYQRPKLEEFDDHLFIVTRLLKMNEGNLHNDQLSLFVKENIVITIQEYYDDYFEAIRTRIRSGRGHLRSSSSDYLSYTLLDSIVDTYFPLLEVLGERLDELEDELFTKPTRNSLQRIQQIKRELIVLRRSVFAERDKVNDILRSTSGIISDQTKLYFRDTYDHTIQVMDLVESYKEITASLMDIYLSSVSNKLNAVMKVLAVISTIFIPLTFIVGVYGMNFPNVDPETGQKLPLNMPELYSPYGYVGVMLFMLILVLIQLYVFWRKGWMDKT